VRITREKLLELALRETEQRASHGNVISGYIIGSVAKGTPLLGGTADIDLVLIHNEDPGMTREMVPLSHQVHLDIAHHTKDLYASPRDLRVHPWIGPAICEPVFLYDPQHFFEWAQAGARGQFYRPDHTLVRAKAFLSRARQARGLLPLAGRWLKIYTRAALEAANAAVSLCHFPVAGRRLTHALRHASDELGHPAVYDGFTRLIGADHISRWDVPEMLSAWARAFDAASQISKAPELAPCRRNYYQSGFHIFVEAGHAEAIVWTLLTSWEQAIHALTLSEAAAPHIPAWESSMEGLDLSENSADTRAHELEDYIDYIEETIDAWATQKGA
jgi:hypothetical protein